MKSLPGKCPPPAGPPAPVEGCRHCWVAPYCARYNPDNPQQPPPTCPLQS